MKREREKKKNLTEYDNLGRPVKMQKFLLFSDCITEFESRKKCLQIF